MRSVGVIGGGVAGLQASKALKRAGFKVTLFEKATALGGVWQANYPNAGVQVPAEFYAFPDFPAKYARGSYVSAEQVAAYARAFAEDAGIMPMVRLSAPVQSVSQAQGGGWTFELPQGRAEHFDLCVMATGMYSRPAPFPRFEGQDDFEAAGGRVLHSSQLTQGVGGKDNVVVVGGGKSAADIATLAASKSSGAATLVQRQLHWSTPRYIAGLIPFQYIFLSRFGQALVSLRVGEWPDRVSGQARAATVLSKPLFAAVEAIFAAQQGSWPKANVVNDFYGYAQVTDPAFTKAVGEGRIKVHAPATVSRLEKNTAVLSDGSRVKCDLLVMATGFKSDFAPLSESVRGQLDIQSDGLWLYRHILPPAVPGLAIVGSALTISNIATSHLMSQWLARAWSGSIALPSRQEMEASVERMRQWKRSWMPETASRAHLVLLHQIAFHDTIFADMGLSPRRKGGLGELLLPYESKDLRVP